MLSMPTVGRLNKELAYSNNATVLLSIIFISILRSISSNKNSFKLKRDLNHGEQIFQFQFCIHARFKRFSFIIKNLRACNHINDISLGVLGCWYSSAMKAMCVRPRQVQ